MANDFLYPESKLSSKQLKIIELAILIFLFVLSSITAIVVGLSICDIEEGVSKTYTFKYYKKVEYGKGDRPYQIFVEEEETALHLDSGANVSVLQNLTNGDTFNCRVKAPSNGVMGYQYCYDIIEMTVGSEVIYPYEKSVSNAMGARICGTVMCSLTAVIMLIGIIILLVKDRQKNSKTK